jgi:hypothetical protein
MMSQTITRLGQELTLRDTKTDFRKLSDWDV